MAGPPQPRLLAPYEGYIRQRTPEGCWNAAVLFDEIQAQGYTGGRTLLKDFLQPLRPRAARPGRPVRNAPRPSGPV